ncbi:hypothetical protein FWG95_03765 [Candidatus Saccharibacteria bacterium]|nr:hypothetical protein [Candidatus Saccharibacteria bacterium]
MNPQTSLKEILLQIRYPYTAGIIAIMWIGIAILASMRDQLELELLIGVAAVFTIIIAAIGFSSPKR